MRISDWSSDVCSSDLGWRFSRDPRTGASLGALNASVRVPGTEAGSGQWLRRFLAFLGPGYMVSVGYMDPGNWATDLAGGSQFGYPLLCVILLSNVMAIVLQALAARLGLATGRGLAQACRDHYPRPVAFVLGGVCEVGAGRAWGRERWWQYVEIRVVAGDFKQKTTSNLRSHKTKQN